MLVSPLHAPEQQQPETADLSRAHSVQMPLSSVSLTPNRVLSQDELPRQKQFLKHDIVPSAVDTAIPQPGTECGVCLQELPVPDRPFGPETTTMVVFLKPCTHFFHKGCIVEWHTSARPERNTCPICRRILFVADPLNPAQIQQLNRDMALTLPRRPLGPHRRPGWNEELLDWEGYTIWMYAQCAVRKEIDRVLICGGKHRWVQVCKEVRDKMLAAGGTLRPEFEPYRDSFLLLVHATPVLLAIATYDHAIRCRAFAKFNDWIMRPSDTLGNGGVELSVVMRWDGLFVSDTLRVVTVHRVYRQAFEASFFRLCEIRAEMKRRRTRRSMGGLLQRFAGFVLPGRLVQMLCEGGLQDGRLLHAVRS